jgi:hypothetical protein
MPLSAAQIAALLNKDSEPDHFLPPPQVGPLRITEKSERCTHQRENSKFVCKVHGYYKVQGKRRCSVHALQELNELLVEKGVTQ